MNKKVSVIMPVYNSEKYLSIAIQSILDQTYKNIELIIINDGSTDKSLYIISQFSDSRIVLIDNKKNYGLSYSRNLGLKKSTGQYICFMDSDDLAYSKRIEKQVNFLEKNKDIDILSTGFDEIWNDKIVKMRGRDKTSDQIKIELMFRCCIGNPTAMIRKNIIDKYGISYREGYFVAEDYAFWIDCLKDCNFYHIGESFLAYRTGHDNITSISRKTHSKRTKDLLDKIRMRALAYNEFLLEEKDLKCFNKFFCDPPVEVSMEDIDLIKKILNKMVKQNDIKCKFSSKEIGEIFKYLLVSRLIEQDMKISKKLSLMCFKFKDESYKSIIGSILRIIKSTI